MADSNRYPPELKYNQEHTWIKLESGNRGRSGITFYAQEQLKDVVFVELPEIGSDVVHMEPFGVVESAKATNDLYSPVSGKIVEANQAVVDDPSLVNRDPYGEGWMIVVELSRPDEVDGLMTADEYRTLTDGEGQD